jgi:hypothetical protein
MEKSMSLKITFAVETTDQAFKLIESACQELEGSLVVNGAGIFRDPSSTHFRLKAARDHINSALTLLEKVDWPTCEDY